MKKHTPSVTAELAAMIRAVAVQFQLLKRIFDDRFAVYFCDIRTFPAHCVNRLISLFDPSLTRFSFTMTRVGVLCALVRHRFIEDSMKKILDSGVIQVVLLGAGYDTKSLRAVNKKVRFFELDYPATQQRKRAIIHKRNFIPGNTTYIPCYLSITFPSELIIGKGLDSTLPVLVIAEGLLSYLTRARIRDLFCDMQKLSNDVHVIFDYRHPPCSSAHSVKKWYDDFRRKGETYLSQLDSSEMDMVLDQAAFSTVSADDLHGLALRYGLTIDASGLRGASEVRVARYSGGSSKGAVNG